MTTKVMLINEFGNNEVHDMQSVPRTGDKVDAFGWGIPPTVNNVLWLPKGAHPTFPGVKVDVVITLD